MNAEKLFEKLINNEITREEFEVLLESLEDDQLRAQYDQYLESRFMEEIESHFSSSDKPDIHDRSNKTRPGTDQQDQKKIKKYYPVAAIVLLILGISFSIKLILAQFTDQPGQDTAAIQNEVPLLIKNTPNKRMFRMRLEDGSFVHLNAVSFISYPKKFDHDKREVEVKGEAYFDIERDEDRPFKIRVKDYSVQVLGTSFDIKAYENEEKFSVTVESGTVRVDFNTNGLQPVVLTKNQKMVYSPENQEVKIMEVNPEDELSWRKGILRFNSTPMTEVEKMLERWYGIDVVIKNEDIYRKSLTGIHQNENIKSVLESLTYATGTKYLFNGNKVIIKN